MILSLATAKTAGKSTICYCN